MREHEKGKLLFLGDGLVRLNCCIFCSFVRGKRMEFEDFCFSNMEETEDKRVLVLIIYDIVDNKKRLRLAKYLQGYGFRIQKSAFEALLKENLYDKMVAGLRGFASEIDSIRVYKIIGKKQIKNFGYTVSYAQEDLIIV